SLEITSADGALPATLAGRLPAGTALYVAHTPNAKLADVAEVACAAELAGFRGCPHLVARRIASRAELDAALARLRKGGVSSALLVAGDLTPPAGEYASTLDVLDSGALDDAGLSTVGVAGHPEGNPNIPPDVAWDALLRKQAWAARTGVAVHVTTQFGFDAAALAAFDAGLAARGISLPVHVGVAGPASLKSLAKFAVMCGIGASLAAVLSNPLALGSLKTLVRTIDEVFPAVVARAEAAPRRFVQPHFFAFGGVMKTVEWLEAVRAGRFDVADGKIAIRN
ncbi:MAG TPA: methylenetetrahydrofolate reductase, partial [Steroidobacteraceae bacterium]|nr:methylenetetrahydrofolate reductase [Steroidobacteraceae bacterium]